MKKKPTIEQPVTANPEPAKQPKVVRFSLGTLAMAKDGRVIYAGKITSREVQG